MQGVAEMLDYKDEDKDYIQDESVAQYIKKFGLTEGLKKWWNNEKKGEEEYWENEKKKGNVITNRQDENQFLRYNAINKSTYKYTKPKG